MRVGGWVLSTGYMSHDSRYNAHDARIHHILYYAVTE